MTTIESYILGYQKHLADLTPKLINNSAYENWVKRYVELLSLETVDFGNDVIAGYLGEYISIVREKKNLYPDVYEKLKRPDPFLSDIEWVMDTIIKEKRYSRLGANSAKKPDNDLKKEIALKALQMPYSEAVNFMGELAGAWVASYPISSIAKYETLVPPRKDATEEEYIYILVRRLQMEFLEWRR
jgi:hypothetical protein